MGKIRTSIIGRSKWSLTLMVIALILLLGSASALVYTTINKEESDFVEINGKEYDWNTIYDEFNTVDMEGHEGVPLDQLIIDAGVDSPEDREYKINGADGYTKTVNWQDMNNGILTVDGKKTVFEGKAKAFWVKEVVAIEVK